ncbi:MAG: AraC family transcriptional regulator [Eubacteriales bacterium]|nr:AraC family transcriptional regulator [Eubacteriales bacterium]
MDYTHVPAISCLYSDKTKNVFSQTPASGSLIDSEAHFEYEMILVTGGRASAVINHKTYELHPGTLIFISRLERHSFVIHDEPYCRYVVSMSNELIMSSVRDIELVSILMQRPHGFSHVIQLSDSCFRRILPLFEYLTAEYTNQQAFFVSRSISLVNSILILLYRDYPDYFPVRSATSIQTLVLQAQRYVNENFSQKITLNGIAGKSFVSRHSLSLAFKDTVGVSFREYLILFRLAEAKKLLVTTDLSVDEISEQVGYQNVNNFIQIFKSRNTLTPLQYRKRFTSSRPDNILSGH